MSRHPRVALIVMQKQVMTPNFLVHLERSWLAPADMDLSAPRKLLTLAMLNSITSALARNGQRQRGHQYASAYLNSLQMGSYPHLLPALSEINDPLDLDSAFEQAIVSYLRGVGVGKYPHA
ncbi:TetR/AcrR family transcriptional regulator C-terminal domain-containing protein [Glutamicibacter sp. JL.03c]|uniref:TetR/AcrR family transcriptional regulator C-terminal domain-containing protein n=1 Tax=Glutamicibacter sp. JL.03c TaxID=2984842 RepID=UPI0021F79BE3|nr:TetR/AcrR family transcriptional regulator C-terminal domain-containing protein [Glutamicibacter sp. JL.03c]UYQ78943.1 TetR/AcrR family transcriptional regulator C-terminal domain-containing protein [Glutamicibacter sp. JL.03c]